MDTTRAMTTKLTLTVEATTIIGAKSYAKQTGRSLSELVENYFRSLISEQKDNDEVSDKIKSIAGTIKLPANFDEKKEICDYLKNKHL